MSGWLLSYDVSADGRRAKVAALLERRGARLLYSTFALDVEGGAAQTIYADVERRVESGDHLLLLRTCARCRIRRLGGWAARAQAIW